MVNSILLEFFDAWPVTNAADLYHNAAAIFPSHAVLENSVNLLDGHYNEVVCVIHTSI